MKAENIVLCGFMGSGKSTVGRLLSRRLGREFIDLDSYIEKAAGQTVREIFAAAGEEGFRRLETAAVAELCGRNGLVLALGGGTVLKAENVAFLKQNGLIFYLSVSAKTVLQRLKEDTSRPLLMGSECEKMQKVEALMQQRAPLYTAAADLEICADTGAEEVAEQILLKLHS